MDTEKPPIGLVYGYVRVSPTEKQSGLDSIERQRAELVDWATKKGHKIIFFQDTFRSGKNVQRPGLVAMLAAIEQRRPQAVAVTKLGRLGRSMVDLAQIAETLRLKNISILAIREGIDTSKDDIVSRTLFLTLSFASELERQWIRERTNAGRQEKYREYKEQGRHWGRPIKIDRRRLDELLKLEPRPSVKEIAAELNCSKQLIYRMLGASPSI